MMMRTRLGLLLVMGLFLLTLFGTAAAHETGDILIYDVWARPTIGRDAAMGHGGMNMGGDAASTEEPSATEEPSGQMQHGGMAMGSGPSLPSAAYFMVENRGDHPIVLMAAEMPLAGRTEIHQTIVENNVARMEEADGGVEIAPGETFAFAPGGYHIMLLELTRDLVPGETLALALTFEMRDTEAEPITMIVAALVQDLPYETGGLVVSLAEVTFDEAAPDEATATLRIENRGDEDSALADISHMGVALPYTLVDSVEEEGVQMATVELADLLRMMLIPDSHALPITLSLADGTSFDIGLPLMTEHHMAGEMSGS
jgi:hypothetical protein